MMWALIKTEILNWSDVDFLCTHTLQFLFCRKMSSKYQIFLANLWKCFKFQSSKKQ